MIKPVRWGILGAANIAIKQVIPGIRQGESGTVVAIASRSAEKAEDAARALGIPRAYASYQALLDDAEVDAIYNPLPNHLHVPWSVKAADAGKHVLCEKPIALNAREVHELMDARDRNGVVVGEAFMVRAQPRWLAVKRLVSEGRIGDIGLIVGALQLLSARPERRAEPPRMGWWRAPRRRQLPDHHVALALWR